MYIHIQSLGFEGKVKKIIWIWEGKINTCIIFFLFHSLLIEISHAAKKASAATWFKHAISCLSLNSLSNERSIPYLSSRVRKYNSWNWLTYRWPLGVAGSLNLNTLLLSWPDGITGDVTDSKSADYWTNFSRKNVKRDKFGWCIKDEDQLTDGDG